MSSQLSKARVRLRNRFGPDKAPPIRHHRSKLDVVLEIKLHVGAYMCRSSQEQQQEKSSRSV
jgi:hypothetical protein